MAGLGLAGLCLLPVIFLGVLAVLSWRPPALGVVDGQLTPCPNRPNCVSTQATDPEHRMEPIPFSGTAEEMRSQLRVALHRVQQDDLRCSTSEGVRGIVGGDTVKADMLCCVQGDGLCYIICGIIPAMGLAIYQGEG